MNNRQRTDAILHYHSYDRMPVVAFGFWAETVEKWANEGYISHEDADAYNRYGDGGPGDTRIMEQLGFDFDWNNCPGGSTFLKPSFETVELRREPDGSRIIRDGAGLIKRIKDGCNTIPSMVGTALTSREAWEEMYVDKLQFSEDRIDADYFRRLKEESETRDIPMGLHLGSLYGNIRNMLGVEELAYLAVDDEDLYIEIIDTVGELCYKVAEYALTFGVQFDYAHFWEDICFRNGPLVRPEVFAEYVGPHYKRLTKLMNSHGIDIVSVDCDGCIDFLVPVWLENGVNTMFPIEVGTWNASIAPWREKYGRELRGVGGMDKRVFAHERSDVDAEIERLKKLVDLGGYIPCPDHRIAPDAKYEMVKYYCEKFRKEIK